MEHDRPPAIAAPNLEKRSFYVLGGTLQHDASCYVSRRCDETLFHSLQAGAFCYVLTSRQMGKSSLMVRTAARLRADGDSVAVIDLSAIGQNLSAEQWYDSLLGRVGEQLELEDALDDFWQLHARLSPLQRFTGALLEVVLPSRPGRVVIFIDEIDAVRSLPFSTDELFAAIRELYNRRTGDPSLNRLTFCLLGVATPSDLIRDRYAGPTRTTPFNIGVRIELEDFTEPEAAPLAGGLGRDGLGRGALLGRILHWTGGHPYLTQRLCQALADDSSITTEREVDGLCHSLFLSSRSRERDDNLLFVRERLMRSEVELAGLLDLYKQVRRGKRVADDERSPLIDVLRLSGVVRVEHGHMQVRNRIYAGAFDLAWVDANMPDAELRRQRAAFRRGLRNASLVALGVLSIMGVLGLFGLQQWNEAEKLRGIAEKQRVVAEEQRAHAVKEEREGHRRLYDAHMKLAQQEWKQANIRRMVSLLEEHIPKAGEEDLRGFEWYYLWQLCHREERVLHLQSTVRSVSYSPDGTLIATGSDDGTAALWDAAAGQQLRRFQGHHSAVQAVVFSPDGKRLVSTSDDKTVKIWESETGLELHTLPHPEKVLTAALSPDGHVLATGAEDGVMRLWDPSSGLLLATLLSHQQDVTSVRFSPDGTLLASSSLDGKVLLWDTRSHRIRARLGGKPRIRNANFSVAFSPDGKKLAYSYDLWSVRVLELATQRRLLSIEAHRDTVTSVAFSPDGRNLATSSRDGSVKLWDTGTGKALGTLLGHRGSVLCLSFSPDGKHLVTGGDDKTARLWTLEPEQTWSPIEPRSQPSGPLVFSGDGTTLITDSQNHNHNALLFWDVKTQRLQRRLPGRGGQALLAFAPDGSALLGAAHNAHGIEVRNLLQGETLASFPVSDQEELPALALSARDGKAFVVVHSQTSVWIQNLVEKRTLVTLDVPTQIGAVSSAAISHSGQTAAIGGYKRAWLWDLDSNQQLCELTGHSERIIGIAFSPDGRLLATAGLDRLVKLWDVPGCREIKTLSGPRGRYVSAHFSPDGRRLATGTADGTIVLWDVLTGLDLIALEGPPLAGYLEFSPDGRLLAGAGFNEPGVHLWRTASPEEVEAQRGE